MTYRSFLNKILSDNTKAMIEKEEKLRDFFLTVGFDNDVVFNALENRLKVITNLKCGNEIRDHVRNIVNNISDLTLYSIYLDFRNAITKRNTGFYKFTPYEGCYNDAVDIIYETVCNIFNHYCKIERVKAFQIQYPGSWELRSRPCEL